MDYVGEILGDPDSPEIDKQRWIDVIRDHPNLVPPQPRHAINPFTKQPMVLRPRPEVAHVVIDGKNVETMSWAEDDSNFINVFGESKAVIPVARDIARSLGGRFESVTDV